MDRIGPALSYFGSKWRAAAHYPCPEYRTIIEPFAGGAGYSLLHHTHQVLLRDSYQPVIDAWSALIDLPGDYFLGLPDVETDLDALDLPKEVKALIGYWINASAERPYTRPSKWFWEYPERFWGEKVRSKIAIVADSVGHWTIEQGDYKDSPDIEATWFIDPPYIGQGHRYPHGSRGIDYDELAEWCRSRKGQVIVCEQTGADWLPFEHFRSIRSNQANSGRNFSAEAIWTNRDLPQLNLFMGDEL